MALEWMKVVTRKDTEMSDLAKEITLDTLVNKKGWGYIKYSFLY